MWGQQKKCIQQKQGKLTIISLRLTSCKIFKLTCRQFTDLYEWLESWYHCFNYFKSSNKTQESWAHTIHIHLYFIRRKNIRIIWYNEYNFQSWAICRAKLIFLNKCTAWSVCTHARAKSKQNSVVGSRQFCGNIATAK